jgi:RNA polymerase sigma-70 factor (ECF subfamily)
MPQAPFPVTQWSIVRSLQGRRTEEVQRGLTRLCESYWYPVYAFIRRAGNDPGAAEDLTQEFFLTLIAKERFDRVAPELGRFRSYLLAAVKHFLANQRERDRAQKRGGGVAPLSLDFGAAEDRYRLDPPAAATPETEYEVRWAHTVFDQAVRTLHGEFVKVGKAVQFQAFRPFLLDDDPPSYAAVAARLNMTESTAKVGVHRMRKRWGEILRAQINETVSTAEEAEQELRFVFEILKRR